MSTPRHSRNRIQAFLRPFLFAELVAVALFVVGPQAGSFDDDGDGIPDIPVVVSGTTFVGDVSAAAGASQRPQELHHVVASAIIRMHTRHVGKSDSVSDRAALDGRSVLRGSSLLRC